jgi:phosphonate transport system substrate-binding protein
MEKLYIPYFGNSDYRNKYIFCFIIELMILRILTIISFLFTVIFSAGCEETGSEQVKNPAPRQIIRIGILPEINIFEQTRRYQPLADYLSDKARVKIELKTLTRYNNIIGDLYFKNLDGAFFGSFTYTLAKTKYGVEAIARPENTDGSSTYHGLIIVRKDSGIRTAKDMKGRTFAFIDVATTSGYIFPLHYFRMNSISNYRKYFRETYFGGTHENVISDVLNRKADIGAVKNTVFERLKKDNSRLGEEIVILERSPDAPENGLALRKDIDPEIKKKIKQALLLMHEDEEGSKVLNDFGAAKFIATSDSDYRTVYRYVHSLGIDFMRLVKQSL